MQHIFVIEDDENICNLITIALEGYGYRVTSYEAAEPALESIETEKPDLAIFDLMLPGMDGLEAIAYLRRQKSTHAMPLMILTARDKEYDKVIGLDGGADDYLTKPFSVLELAARIRSLLRRTDTGVTNGEQDSVTFDSLYVNLATREVFVQDVPVTLTYKEYELLCYLIENRSRVVGREELLNKLWDYNTEIETRTLDIHIRTLRQKLGETGNQYIQTVRRVGYRFIG